MNPTRVAMSVAAACAVALALAGCAVTPSTPDEFALVQYPAATFRGLYAQTAAASKSVDMEMYEVSHPHEIAALIAAHKRGLTVRVLLDSAYEIQKANTPAFNTLKAGGVEVRWAPTSTIFHIKLTVFDATTADVASANLTPVYYSTTRDAEIVDTYPVQVKAIESTFDSDWNGGNPASDESNAPGLVWSPDAESAMVNEIESAHYSVDFTSEELSDRDVVHALEDVAGRGVSCRIVMNDDDEWSQAFGQVSAAGCFVHVLPETKSGLYMHEKIVLVDAGEPSSSVLLGSQNASYSSLAFNRELSLLLTGAQAPSVVGSITRTFNSDFAAAERWPTN